MGLWRQITRGLQTLLRREAADREIADEVRHYLDAAEAELVAGGATAEEARRAVRLKYGDAGNAREDVRSYGWESVAESFLADVRYGARRLRQSPGFTIVAVLTLGLGIGASTAIFGAVSPVLFEPLGYPHAERLVDLADQTPDGSTLPVTFGTYVEVSLRSRSFEALAVGRAWQPTVTGRAEPQRLEGRRVSADYFRVLGVAPALGPGFDASDDRVDGLDAVILGDALWRQAFGADSSIVGEVVRLDDRPFTVVGVMPSSFDDVPGQPAQLWSLLQYDASLPSFDGREWGHHLDMIARLREGVDVEAARAELIVIAARPLPELTRPVWASMGEGLAVRGLQRAATEGVRPVLLSLVGAVTLLMGIACLNVTNLVLARGARRRGELAMRAALGAARGRVVRQLLTESLLLAGLGGVVGIGVARVGVAALVALSPPELPRLGAVGLDGAAFVFALGVTTLVGVVVGLAPSLGVRGGDLERDLREASRSTLGGHLSTRRTLVVAEVALALVLLVGAGLLLRSMQRLFAVAPGFDAAHEVVMKVQVAGLRFDDEATHRFYAQALEAVRRVPGVESAALTSQLPLSGDPTDGYGIRLEDAPLPAEAVRNGFRYAVSPSYLRTMGIPLLQGRFLDEHDVSHAPLAVVVNDALARSAFPGRDPVGRRVHMGSEEQPWYTVVGVVGDVKQTSLGDDRPAAFYVTPEQWYFADRARWVVARTEGDPASLTAAIKRAIWSVDPDQPIVRAATMESLVTRSESQRRFAMIVLEAFAVLALVLAAIGLYGVLSGSVNERLREIGVRAALGASRERLVGMVVRQGLVLTGAGVALGLVGAAFASELVTTMLFGVSRLDPVTYLGVVAVFLAVASVACWIPAARAARVDPVSTLRAD